jgi:hypothetical protein
MTSDLLTSTLNASLDVQIRMLIAGSLAELAGGHSQGIHDLGNVPVLNRDYSAQPLSALIQLDFKSRLPVDPFGFYDPAEWPNAARISLLGFHFYLPVVSKPTLLAMKRQTASFRGDRIAQPEGMANHPLIENLRWACEMSEVIRMRDLTNGRTTPALNSNRYN